MMKKTIVFDLGGVLIDWDRRYLYQKIFSDEEELNYFLNEVCTYEWNLQTDLTKTFQEAMDELVLQFPHYEKQIRAYFPRWEEMIAGAFRGTVEILRDLKVAGYPLAVLSNWSAETFPKIRHQYEFLDWFNPLLISGRIGYKKPDPKAFQILLSELDQPAEDCVFIDDSSDNIEVASELGFNAIHFVSPDLLREDLIRSGYLNRMVGNG
jgi:2-haloacid dehalogenase